MTGLGASLPPRIAESTGPTYYVGGAGASDSNPGSSALPWATVTKAHAAAPQGSTVKVRPGTYPEGDQVVNRGGTPTSVITIEADDPANKPTILGRFVFAGINAAYLRLRNVNYDGDAAVTSVVKLTDTGPDHSLYGIGAHHIEFYNCQFMDSIGSGAGILTSGSSVHHIQFWNCIAHDNSPTTTTAHGWYINGGYEIHLINCIARDNGGYGYHVYKSGASTLRDIFFYNCKGYSNNLRGGFIVTDDGLDTALTTVRAVHFYNCEATFNNQNPGSQFGFEFRFSAISDFTGYEVNTMNNCFSFGNANGDITTNGKPACVVNTNFKTGQDPLYFNPVQMDFHPRPGSPLIGLGLGEYTPPMDIDGVIRQEVVAGPYVPSTVTSIISTPANNTSFGTGTVASGTPISVTKPTGVINGDLVIVAISTTDPADFTPPAGWTQLYEVAETTTDSWLGIYTKLAAAEGASWSFTSVGTETYAYAVLALRGVHPTTPIGASACASQPLSKTQSTPAIVVTTPNAFIVGIWEIDGAGPSVTWTPPGSPFVRAVEAVEGTLFQAVMIGFEDLNNRTGSMQRTATGQNDLAVTAIIEIVAAPVAAPVIPDKVSSGYLRNADGALITVPVGSAAAPTKWQDGKLRDAAGKLVVTTSLSGAKMKGGFLQGPSGELVVANPGTPPYKWREGEYIDANSALVTTAWPGGGQRFRQGYLRVSSGPLVVV